MGKVVDLETALPQQRKSGAGRSGRRRRRPSKAALVLGGGGFTGGVYEVGALRALDLLSVDTSITDFDIYVGTSAGAVVASLAAASITPEQMMRVVNDQAPLPFAYISSGQMLKPNLKEFAASGLKLPRAVSALARELPRALWTLSPVDLAITLADLLPTGIYTGAGIERYVREVLSTAGRSDDFRALRSELYLAATDLDTCERIVLGAEGWDDVPISEAVRASSALPMLYRPHTVKGRELIDGGIVSTTNLDIAVEAGAKLIVVVNPLVPYINDFDAEVRTVFGRRPRRVSDHGFTKIGYQTFKLLAYQRLHEMARQWGDRYPGVDIVLIEPEPDDALMFETDIMDYGARRVIAQHGFESVALKLAAEYDRYEEVAARHGIRLSATRVRKVAGHLTEQREPVSQWRRLLGQTAGALRRDTPGTSAAREIVAGRLAK